MQSKISFQPKSFVIILFASLLFTGCASIVHREKNYFVNSISGNDSNDGLSQETAWKSLGKASQIHYSPGEKLLLCQGCTFYGKLHLQGGGSETKPVIISSYDPENGKTILPVINAKGYLAAIQITNGKNFEISKLELTADAGDLTEPEAKIKRYGVYIVANQPGEFSNIQLKNLNIHHIFATDNVKGNGQNPTSNMGYGIYIGMTRKDAKIKNIKIEECNIEMTGHTGIRIFGFGDKTGSTYLDGVTILNNHLKNIGGPGMVPGRCENVVVRGNVVDRSGSSIDPRMHARGSGIWPWTCNNVLIEKNKFMHARGKNDSCGTHIDFNCNNVVVQYNLSLDNAGGFVEILGNDHNCCYRYNISINDGFRIKGENKAQKDGHILWTSGYVGNGNKRVGPFNSYIYNNTVYVKGDIRSSFSCMATTKGILIANNIFYIVGKSVNVSHDDNKQIENQSATIENVVFKNNLYSRVGILPASLVIKDSSPVVGSAGFKNAGGTAAKDYIPENSSLIKNKGVKIEKIPGDKIGLLVGLEVKTDYFGNPILGLPDMGAVEMK